MIEVRPPAADELEAWAAATASAFGSEVDADELPHFRGYLDAARNLAAYADATPVATVAAVAFALSVPGGELPAAGVTEVGVSPAYRRRGILTALMRRQLDDVRAWGEPLAVLQATEAAIYGRYGYGLATTNASIDADARHIRLPAAAEDGRIRLVDHEEALALLPQIYDRERAATPGFHSRTREWWEHKTLPDEEGYRHGAGPLQRAVLERDGRPEAYALYRVENASSEGFPDGALHVQEEVACTPHACRQLWRYLLGMDLVGRVRAAHIAPDHPLLLLAMEPARLRLRVKDGLFVRLVDVPAALTGRRYQADDTLILEVEDAFCPWNAGRWRLAAHDGQAQVEPAEDTAADVRLTVADLATVYLGGFTFLDLLRAGRVDELTDGAVARATTLFRGDRAPFSCEDY
ncbi:MAG TPA: GNAT family N-acetyltransferase [Conexibacter sp.]|nr:GNAT family N-acetyltransferase [Conexibacter sp.]